MSQTCKHRLRMSTSAVGCLLNDFLLTCTVRTSGQNTCSVKRSVHVRLRGSHGRVALAGTGGQCRFCGTSSGTSLLTVGTVCTSEECQVSHTSTVISVGVRYWNCCVYSEYVCYTEIHLPMCYCTGRVLVVQNYGFVYIYVLSVCQL